MEQAKLRRPRLERLDALRGLAVVLMVVFHILYDLIWLFDAPNWIFYNPVLTPVRYLVVGVFVATSGISCRLSRSNARRGVRLLAVAMGFTIVTSLLDMPILFGVLHLLAVCMLIYALLGRWSNQLPVWVLAGAFVLSLLWINTTALRSALLWVLGVPFSGIASWDYYPLFPWLFLFLIGARLSGTLETRQFVALPPTRISRLGRRALPIYMLHQPVLVAVLLLLRFLLAKGS